MIITYLVFGKDISNYKQAVFSILTFLPKIDKNEKIVVVTDSPENFNFLKEKICIFETDNTTLNKWKGQYNFFWRIKIMALLFVAEKFKDSSILYLDSDTFLFGDLDSIRLTLNNGINIMHSSEGKLSQLSSKTEKLMWKQLKGKIFGNIKIDSNKYMWNAGVVGISYKNINKIKTALQVCDEMSKAEVTPRLIEQFALSIALSEPERLFAAKNEIGHYWGNKPMWNKKIQELLVSSFIKRLTVEELTKEAAKVDFTKIPIRIMIRNSKRRLEKQLSYIFPDKKKEYIAKTGKSEAA
jgi:hypothetical protein